MSIDKVASAPLETKVSRGISAPGSAVSVESLSKCFGTVRAVSKLTLSLHAGECLGVLGPNGAGKSTLIRAIAGRVIPDSGQIRILGHAAGSRQARAALGWVPQEIALYPRLTCRENLETFGRFHGLRGQPLRSAVDWCLHWAALEDRAGDIVRMLSGGMKRRLNMAAGMIHRPRIVLMDEPTVGVDPQSRNRIFEMIETLRCEGTSILYTTHYMEEAERLCDQIAIVDHGQVIASGSNAELVARAFASQCHVVIKFTNHDLHVEEWIQSQGGRVAEAAATFALKNSTEVAGLLESATASGFEVADLSLRKPNLESVFLHLTGRDLRE